MLGQVLSYGKQLCQEVTTDLGPAHGCGSRREGGVRGNRADTEKKAGLGVQVGSLGGRARELSR